MQHFIAWARENTSSHRCMVMVRDQVIIGMAWLAVLPRVPSPRALHRASGDLQCVYVVPGERDGGLGGRLIDAVLDRARELGLERVTVHSSPRAVPAYSRHGFNHRLACFTPTLPAPPPIRVTDEVLVIPLLFTCWCGRGGDSVRLDQGGVEGGRSTIAAKSEGQ